MASSQQPSNRPSTSEPVLITEARISLAEEQAARKKRYVLTMACRMVAVVLAVVMAPVGIWFSAVFIVLGTFLPWIAVMMANDAPPKKKLDANRYRPPAPDRILESGSSSKARVIDM
ncbi:DUF3099 domain-containing protein [Modestobacter sp. NPDC049651]|uniref:DUF3099 domain-containing protein n=1 Tax=unclassified Modestobacter TaxID=2643866 RepID=UPI0033E7715E